ncbi:helix-turn-helix domain-containing protein [Microbacterium sp. NPDC056234]|uniref:helix-turn-helix domain-containing protein n=1 Tax=Microbacterium sp. NPDC056234 TaxID=3345757 RepID=UPI0035D9DCBF
MHAESGVAGPVLIRHRAPPLLDGIVAGIVGFQERATEVVTRRQHAGSLIPVILSSGPRLDVTALADGAGVGTHSSFIAGFMPGHATTAFDGEQRCIQIYLTPLGVQRLLALPGREVARRIVDIEDVAPFFGEGFHDELWSSETWEQRFALIDRTLIARLDQGVDSEAFVVWMWEQIRRTGGRARIADLVERTGWSQRYVTSLFTEQVGLGPKLAARIVRFEHASSALRRSPVASVAADFGYADQSHLAREVRWFSGRTITELKRTAPVTAQAAIGIRVDGTESAARARRPNDEVPTLAGRDFVSGCGDRI